MSLGELERVPRRRPLALLAFAVLAVLIELSLAWNTERFSDLNAWHWRTKEALVTSKSLDGTIAVLGTSISFHGLDPAGLEPFLDPGEKVVNLSLDGASFPILYQQLQRFLATHHRLHTLILEISPTGLQRPDWLVGPYLRVWATWPEILESGVQYFRPGLLVEFAANRWLPSFCYRRSLRFHLGQLLGQGSGETLSRNRDIARVMAASAGFVPAFYEDQTLAPDRVPPAERRPFPGDATDRLWLERILRTADRAGIRVVLFFPPAPPPIHRDRVASDFYAERDHYLREVEVKTGVSALRFGADEYPLEYFCDSHHFSTAGRHELSRSFGEWLARQLAP